MNKFVNERGFLTDEGKIFVGSFKNEVDKILKIANSENELRLIGSILNSMIGDSVANIIKNNA